MNEDPIQTVRRHIEASRQRESLKPTEEQRAAIVRLFETAQNHSGQSRRVADFLLAWHNGSDNGRWNPADLWAVDPEISRDMIAVLALIHAGPIGHYPPDWGYGSEIVGVWNQWRRPARDAKALEAADPKTRKRLRNTNAAELCATAARGEGPTYTDEDFERADLAALARAELVRRAMEDD